MTGSTQERKDRGRTIALEVGRRMTAEEAARWNDDNRAAIDGSNAYVRRNGLPLAEYRRF
jgi:post-segregation antitoxin (ccd killing protein)